MGFRNVERWCALGLGVSMGWVIALVFMVAVSPDQPTAEAGIATDVQRAVMVGQVATGQAQPPLRYLGDETFDDLSTVKSLTPAAGAKQAEIVAYDGTSRFRGGGNNPTSSVGRPIFSGDSYTVDKPSASYKLIEETSGAKAFVIYWG